MDEPTVTSPCNIHTKHVENFWEEGVPPPEYLNSKLILLTITGVIVIGKWDNFIKAWALLPKFKPKRLTLTGEDTVTKRIKYMDNLHNALVEYSRKAKDYGDGDAWDNRKRKAYKRHAPTGPAFIRLRRMASKAYFRNLTSFVAELAKEFKNREQGGL